MKDENITKIKEVGISTKIGCTLNAPQFYLLVIFSGERFFGLES